MVRREMRVGGGEGEDDRRIFQGTRASFPEAKEEQTLSGGRRKGSAREGSRAGTTAKGRKRKDERGGDADGADERAAMRGRRTKSAEGRAIFLKNIPQTVAREREDEETRR